MSFAEKVRYKRQEKQMSQKELAEMCGVSQAMMCYVENGDTIPTLPLAKRIAKALETSLDFLCDVNGER